MPRIGSIENGQYLPNGKNISANYAARGLRNEQGSFFFSLQLKNSQCMYYIMMILVQNEYVYH